MYGHGAWGKCAVKQDHEREPTWASFLLSMATEQPVNVSLKILVIFITTSNSTSQYVAMFTQSSAGLRPVCLHHVGIQLVEPY